MKVPNTYVIIFSVLLLCAVATWFIPGGVPQTWQVFSALFEGFSQQAGIIAFVLIIGGAFWIVNSTKAVDAGISRFIENTRKLERFSVVRKLGIGNIVIVLVMLLFGVFGAVFGMSEETIAFVAVVIPLAKSLGYDEIVGVCMVYVAAHVGFAGAMLNPFTVGIAQDMSGLPLFSGIEYRTLCWVVLMAIAIVCVLIYASRVKKSRLGVDAVSTAKVETVAEVKSGLGAWISFAVITVALVLFSAFYASGCVVKVGQGEFAAPWLLWAATGLFALSSVLSLRSSAQMYILNLLMFTIVTKTCLHRNRLLHGLHHSFSNSDHLRNIVHNARTCSFRSDLLDRTSEVNIDDIRIITLSITCCLNHRTNTVSKNLNSERTLTFHET